MNSQGHRYGRQQDSRAGDGRPRRYAFVSSHCPSGKTGSPFCRTCSDRARILTEPLEEANQRNATDFGHRIMPHLARQQRLFAYDFTRNRIPGVRWYEERGYWRDVGTHDALSAAKNDVVGARPRFDLRNQRWPIGGAGYRVRTLASHDIGLRDDVSGRRNVDGSVMPLHTGCKDVALSLFES